jgi:hypothetical protein
VKLEEPLSRAGKPKNSGAIFSRHQRIKAGGREGCSIFPLDEMTRHCSYTAPLLCERMIFLPKQLLSQPNLHGDIPGFRRLELHAAQADFCLFPALF